MGGIINALTGGLQAGERMRALQEERDRQAQQQQLIQGLGQNFNPQDLAQLAAINPQAANILQNMNAQQIQQRQQQLSGIVRQAKGMLDRNDMLGLVNLAEENAQLFPDSANQLMSAAATGEIQPISDLINNAALELGIDFELEEAEREAKIRNARGEDSGAKSASQREFESKLEGLTPEQQKQAVLIDLGLAPRAVGSAIQTITDQGIEDEIGKASAKIKQREKFGELTGSSRAKKIDEGFERIGVINKGIGNLDRAIAVVEGGAGVGAINKFLPSFKAASVELDQIQKELALDVIGGVTLGAISEAELDLVKQVAIPKGLNQEELLRHLRERKAAQEKLRAYFNQQIQHLDQGGTVASFLRQQERQLDQGLNQSNQQNQVLRFDNQGNLIQ